MKVATWPQVFFFPVNSRWFTRYQQWPTQRLHAKGEDQTGQWLCQQAIHRLLRRPSGGPGDATPKKGKKSMKTVVKSASNSTGWSMKTAGFCWIFWAMMCWYDLRCAVKDLEDLEGRGPRAQVSLTLALFWPAAVPMMLLMMRALLKTGGRTWTCVENKKGHRNSPWCCLVFRSKWYHLVDFGWFWGILDFQNYNNDLQSLTLTSHGTHGNRVASDSMQNQRPATTVQPSSRTKVRAVCEAAHRTVPHHQQFHVEGNWLWQKFLHGYPGYNMLRYGLGKNHYEHLWKFGFWKMRCLTDQLFQYVFPNVFPGFRCPFPDIWPVTTSLAEAASCQLRNARPTWRSPWPPRKFPKIPKQSQAGPCWAPGGRQGSHFWRFLCPGFGRWWLMFVGTSTTWGT